MTVRGLTSRFIYQHVKILPEILRHEAKKCQEGPPEAVEAGITIVWVPPSFHARVPLRAAPKSSEGQSLINKQRSPHMRFSLLTVIRPQTDLRPQLLNDQQVRNSPRI